MITLHCRVQIVKGDRFIDDMGFFFPPDAESNAGYAFDAGTECGVRAKMIGTKAQKEQLYSINDAMEGTSITIKHFGLTDDGLPRFPIGVGFRDYE